MNKIEFAKWKIMSYVYKVFLPTINQGGCGIYAFDMYKRFPGSELAGVNPSLKAAGMFRHYVVKIGNRYFDATQSWPEYATGAMPIESYELTRLFGKPVWNPEFKGSAKQIQKLNNNVRKCKS